MSIVVVSSDGTCIDWPKKLTKHNEMLRTALNKVSVPIAFNELQQIKEFESHYGDHQDFKLSDEEWNSEWTQNFLNRSDQELHSLMVSAMFLGNELLVNTLCRKSIDEYLKNQP